MKKLFIILVISNFLFAKAQEIPIKPNLKVPTVGLVLSGGGAKGFAHIGVLKTIEKANLKLDYIAGTSMGAAIAALYASGYNAHQIDSIIRNIDFNDMLYDKLERKYYSFYHNKNEEKYLLTLPIHKTKIGLPLALSKGQKTLNTLNKLFEPVDSITDFKKLPIPFFAMATNVETGEPVVLENGKLSAAVRASASLPTVLTPFKIDSQWLIDGGVSDNFPVEEMRAKGIDLIIGVDVQGTLKKSDKIDSAIKLMEQIVNFQLYGRKHPSEQDVDIYIHPDVSEFGLVNFEKTPEIINAGEQAGETYLGALYHTALLQESKRNITPVIPNRQNYLINQIKIKGSKNYTQRYIKGKLRLEAGDSINIETLTHKINYLFATNNFDKIDYQFNTNQQTKQVNLQFDLTENAIKSYLKLGAHYDPLYKLAGLVNFTTNHLIQRNDVFSVDVAFGDNTRTELNYFIDNAYYLSYGLQSKFNQFDTSIDSFVTGVDRLNYQYLDFSNYLYMQSNFNNKFTFSTGFEHKRIIAATNTFKTSPTLNKTYFDNNNYFNILSKLELDTYDQKLFPSKGILINVTHRSFLLQDEYPNFKPFHQFRAKLEGVQAINQKLFLKLEGEGAFSIAHTVLSNFNYALGGYGKNYINNFVPFWGYNFASLNGNSFIKTTGTLDYKFYKNNFVNFTMNYAVVEDYILDYLKTTSYFKDGKTGFAVGYKAKTVIGPLDIKYAWSPENKSNYLYLAAGFWF